MQNAGLQYGQGVTPVQESPFGATTVQNSPSNSTSSLRQFRKKENVDKSPGTGGGLNAANAGTDPANSSHVARVAPHNHYPHKQNEYFRYPPQYQEYNSPYKEHTVKYSEIAEPVPQSIPHLDHLPPSVISKQKEKEYAEMCNIPQQTHLNKPYPEHQFNGQQNYPPEMALHHQYMHKEQGPQLHSPYKSESQYIPKEGSFNHQIPPFLKYNIPQSRNYGPLDNTSLAPFQRMDPHIARSLMTDHPHLRDFSSEYGPMEQSRMYAQKQRYYQSSLPPSNPTYPPNYSHRNMPSQQYNYPSCNYPRTSQMNSSMSRYPMNMERSISPRRAYPDNIDMGMNFAAVPQKIAANYSNYPAYAQHYQHRRPSTVPQDYYHPQQHPHARPHPQYMPTHHPQEVAENHVASNNIRQYLENWAEEEPASEIPAQIENPKYISRINREETNEVYVINASELPQYLENGVPLVTSENGQYILKSNVSIDNTGAIKIIDKTAENSALPTDAQDRVVSLHIVENPKPDCLINSGTSIMNQERSVVSNQPHSATINVITPNSNHSNLESPHNPYGIPGTQFSANRMNLVHQVSSMTQNVPQQPHNYDSLNLTLHPSGNPTSSRQTKIPSSTPETDLRTSLQVQVLEKPLGSSHKLPVTNEVTSEKNRLKIEVLSYNEVPQNSCIVMPSTQNRLNFDESLLPNPVPCDSKETKNEFEVRNDNTAENSNAISSNDRILNEVHEELDKIVEDTLTSSNINIPLESCERGMKIDKCDNPSIVEIGGNSQIPDDLNLDLESHPKDLSSDIIQYNIEENDANEDIIDLSTSRRGSDNDNVEQAIQSMELDLSVHNELKKEEHKASENQEVVSEKTDAAENTFEDQSEKEEIISQKSPIKDMPLIDDHFEVTPTSLCSEVDPKTSEEENNPEDVKGSASGTTEVTSENKEKETIEEIENKSEPEESTPIVDDKTSTEVATSKSSEESPPKPENENDVEMKNEETDIALEEKISAIVGESTEKSEISTETNAILNTVLTEEVEEAPPLEAEEKVQKEVERPSEQIARECGDEEEFELLHHKSDQKKEDSAETRHSTPEKKKEGSRKKRIFSVDDIIYRIGPNSIQNRRQSLHFTPDVGKETESSLEETEGDLPEPVKQVLVSENASIDSSSDKKNGDVPEETKSEMVVSREEKIDVDITEKGVKAEEIQETSSQMTDNASKKDEIKSTDPDSKLGQIGEDEKLSTAESEICPSVNVAKENAVGDDTIKLLLPNKLVEEIQECVVSKNEEISLNNETCEKQIVEDIPKSSCEEGQVLDNTIADISLNVNAITFLVASEDIASVDRTSEFVLSAELKITSKISEDLVEADAMNEKNEPESFETSKATDVRDECMTDVKENTIDNEIQTCEDNQEATESDKNDMNENMDSVEADFSEKYLSKNNETIEDKVQTLNSMPGCRFSVIHKTEDTAKALLQETSVDVANIAKENEETKDLMPEIEYEAHPAEEMIEETVTSIEENNVKSSSSHQSVIQSTEDTVRKDESSKILDKVEKDKSEMTETYSKQSKRKASTEFKKEEQTFEQKFVEPFCNNKTEDNSLKTVEVEEKLTTEDVQYRNVLKIEENNVLLEIGGELVEICVNQVNGKNVITVIPMSNSATVDFNDNYENIDRAQMCGDIENQSEEPTPALLEDTSVRQTGENPEKELPVLIKMISFPSEENSSESISGSLEGITGDTEEIYEDIILNENEIIIGDESLEEEINLDLQNTDQVDAEAEPEKPVLYTKAAKKLYDDMSLKIPTKTSNSLREFRRIKSKPQVSIAASEETSQNTPNIDSREKKSSKRSMRLSTRHRSVSEQKEESQNALRELIKRRKMRKEKIRLKYTQRNESKIVKKNETVSSVNESLKNKEDQNAKLDVCKIPKVASNVVKLKKTSMSSVVKKVKTGDDLKKRDFEKMKKSKEKIRKKSVEETKEVGEQIPSVIVKDNKCVANLDIVKKNMEEKPSSTSVIVSSSNTAADSSPKNFQDACTASTTTEISKNVQEKQSKFPKISTPRDLSLTKNVNEHYLSRKDHSNLKKKLSIQEYNSRKRKTEEVKNCVPEKNRRIVLADEEPPKEKVQCVEKKERPSTIYSEQNLECFPNGLKDPRRRQNVVNKEIPKMQRTSSEDSSSFQTASISSSRPFKSSGTSQSVSSAIIKDTLLNLKDSYSKQLQNYKNYKTLLLGKSSVEKYIPKSMKISNRRKTIEVMNERKCETTEINKKKVSFDDNVQINEIHTTQPKVVKTNPETSNYCEVSSSCSEILEDKTGADSIESICDDKSEEMEKMIKKIKNNQKLKNEWEDSNSPKNSITDAFADSFLEKAQLESLKNKHKGKLIIDINDFDTSMIDIELKSPYRGCFNNTTQTYEDDGSLKTYKEEVDSKLNTLNIQIPKPNKSRVVNEDDILMHKFLRKEQLNAEEIKQIRRIIYLKKKIQQITQQNINTNTKNLENDNDNYEVRKKIENFSSQELKLQLKKIDGKVKKKKKRFRNLYSDSPETSESEIQETAGEFSVYEGENLSGVKLIFKRKTDILHLQPVVKLQRCRHIESMAKNLKFE